MYTNLQSQISEIRVADVGRCSTQHTAHTPVTQHRTRHTTARLFIYTVGGIRVCSCRSHIRSSCCQLPAQQSPPSSISYEVVYIFLVATARGSEARYFCCTSILHDEVRIKIRAFKNDALCLLCVGCGHDPVLRKVYIGGWGEVWFRYLWSDESRVDERHATAVIERAQQRG